MKKTLSYFLLVIFGLLLGTASIQADQRLFAYSYQADSIMPKGAWEFENIITRKEQSDKTSKFAVSQELEYGLTEQLTTAVYLNSEFSSQVNKITSVASEWKYMALSPYTNPIGVMLYGEVKIGQDAYELEEKLVLQHNIQDWVLATNIVLEQEFETENGVESRTGVFELFGAAAYRFSPNFALGMEYKHKTSYNGLSLSSQKGSANYVGPSLNYEGNDWFVTTTVLSTLGENVNLFDQVEAKMIVGYLL